MLSLQLDRHFEAAARAEREGKLPQALQELQAALRLEEDNVQAYLKLGLLQQGAKKFDDAMRYFEKAQQYAPQEAQVVLLVVRVPHRRRPRFARAAGRLQPEKGGLPVHRPVVPHVLASDTFANSLQPSAADAALLMLSDPNSPGSGNRKRGS